MKGRLYFINWPVILLGLVAITGFLFTPGLADEIDLSTGLPSGQQVIAPIEDLQNDFDPQEESFGTNYQYTWVPALSFQHLTGVGTYQFSSYNGYLTAAGMVAATIRLPSGAYLGQGRMYYRDNVAANISFGINRHRLYTFHTGLCSASPTGTPGDTYASCNCSETIANRDNLYHIWVSFSGAGGTNLRFFGVRLMWRRQISPAPVSPTFNDVDPDDWYYQGVEALASSSITIGCGGGNFCPNLAVTRAQMAVFLTKALGLHWAYSDGY